MTKNQDRSLFHAADITKSFVILGTGGKPDTRRTVLKSVSLTVRQSEVVAIVGPSGIGKSTLLRICAGVIEPDSSSDVGGAFSLWRAEGKRAVWQPQIAPLVTVRSIISNVAVGALAIGCDKAIAKKRAEAALEMVGLSERSEDFPNALSVGMRQRVALARTLAARPDIAFLDEPLSSLDPQLRDKLSRGLRQFTEEFGAGVAMVTHTIEEALQYARRFYVLNGEPARVTLVAGREPGDIPSDDLSRGLEVLVEKDRGKLFDVILSALIAKDRSRE